MKFNKGIHRFYDSISNVASRILRRARIDRFTRACIRGRSHYVTRSVYVHLFRSCFTRRVSHALFLLTVHRATQQCDATRRISLRDVSRHGKSFMREHDCIVAEDKRGSGASRYVTQLKMFNDGYRFSWETDGKILKTLSALAFLLLLR